MAVPEIMYDKFRDASPLLTKGSAALKASRLRKMNIILLFFSIKYFDHSLYFISFYFLQLVSFILYSNLNALFH